MINSNTKDNNNNKNKTYDFLINFFRKNCIFNSSAIRQKGEYRNGCYKKTKQTKFSQKQTFLTP